MVKYADLPLSVRKKVDAQIGKKPRRPRGKALPNDGATLRCKACGAEVTATDDGLRKHQEVLHPGAATRYEGHV